MARKISDEQLYDQILSMCGAAGPTKSVTPAAIAQSLVDFDWQSLLKRIRHTAVKLALAGYVNIMRKGKPADPEDFKGVYKIRLVEGVDWQAHLEDESVNKGSGAAVSE